ncbi:LuxR family transcriptional regulator [Streptomyces sp. NPDC051909]|uniref:helix-turn-helix transcriptional regulator n=1 Tax=Streptomyces sp. NPDC051909 TaxID=3154944 RepID=UPI00343155DB
MTEPYACTDPGPGGLVGRGDHVSRVAGALGDARSGRGAAVFVGGEPGVGKTRFALAAAAAARATGMGAAHGRTGTVGPAVPYRPLAEALLALARTEGLPAPGGTGGHRRILARLLGGRGGVPPLAAAEAVLRTVASAAGRRGFLLVLDDLHEADPGTLAVVDYLLDHLPSLPVVLLATVCPGPGPASALAARARHRLDLAPLGPQDVRRLAAAEYGRAALPPELLRRVLDESAGLPFLVRESVRAYGSGGGPAGVPEAVAADVRRRAERLGPDAVRLLGVAALFGERCGVAEAAHAAGVEEGRAGALLRAAADAYLLTSDPDDPAAYAFRHPLAARALGADLPPADRVRAARRAAHAVAELHPGLPGPWCARAAALHASAGEPAQALRRYVEAAHRAGAEGAPERALALLTTARGLLSPAVAPDLRAEVWEGLLEAVLLTGRLDALPGDALEPPADGHGLPAARRAGLYARIAQVHALAGRPEEALRRLDLARWTLGETCDDHAATARVELAAALIEPSRLAPERLRTATGAARRAVDAAHAAGLPGLTGWALLALGRLTQDQDGQGAAERFARARALASPTPGDGALRIAADGCLARLAMRRDGLSAAVEETRRAAERAGLAPQAHETGFALALDGVRRGTFGAAGELIRAGEEEAARRGMGRAVALWRLAEAVRVAHSGRRDELREALGRLAPVVGAAPGLRAMEFGLARGFCSLLQEDHEAAEREFAQALAYDAENPATGDFGRHGVALLCGVLAGRAGRPHHDRALAAGAAAARWNRPFAGLADAVLLGREGRTAEATAAAGAALAAAAPYPLAGRLGMRLVAAAAYEDGWGAPADWAREAEEFFHAAALPAVAGACRGLLRTMGAPVRQRRSGTDRVPAPLRRCGITVREFEVARLLAERFGNRDIAGRLHISPRTVEKHVSSLLQKTGHPNRAAFASAARDLVTGSAP